MSEPDENVIARLGEILAGAQSGAIQGILCVCFMANGSVNVQVSGDQSLIVRLGALQVCADAIKLVEMQKQQNAEQKFPANWGPGGNA